MWIILVDEFLFDAVYYVHSTLETITNFAHFIHLASSATSPTKEKRFRGNCEELTHVTMSALSLGRCS